MGDAVTIYALIDPRSGETHYIGQTAQALELRLQNHINEALSTYSKTAKGEWIRDLCRNRLEPEIRELEVCTVAEAKIIERATVLEYVERGAPLTNQAWADSASGLVQARVGIDVYWALGWLADKAGMQRSEFLAQLITGAVKALPDPRR